MPFPQTDEDHEKLLWLITVVFRVFQGRLAPPPPDQAEGYSPLVFGFPEELSADAWALLIINRVNRKFRCTCWVRMLPPDAAALFRRNRRHWREEENGYPRIFSESGQRQKALRLRYDSCAASHRWNAALPVDDFIKKVVCGTRLIPHGREIENQLADFPNNAVAYANYIETIIRGNFGRGVLGYLMHSKLKLREEKAARLTCPKCNHRFIAHGEKCPNNDCGAEISDQFLITVVKQFWFIDDEHALFLPAWVWPCSKPGCNIHFPYPARFGYGAPKPDANLVCPVHQTSHGQRPKRLYFYLALLPPPEPPPWGDEPVPPKTDSVDLEGEMKEMRAAKFPKWVVDTYKIARLAGKLGAAASKRFCPGDDGSLNYPLLYHCLISRDPATVARILAGEKLSDDAVSALELDCALNESLGNDRVPTPDQLKAEWEGSWRQKVRNFRKDHL